MLNKILNNKFKNKSKKENDIMNKQELRMENRLNLPNILLKVKL